VQYLNRSRPANTIKKRKEKKRKEKKRKEKKRKEKKRKEKKRKEKKRKTTQAAKHSPQLLVLATPLFSTASSV
jgi:hypothetical protein